MADATLEKLLSAAASASEPSLVAEATTKIGGVDPLGLREINFDLMDALYPGFNNVGRHLRPFVVTAWAWRRAIALVDDRGDLKPLVDELKDFVARIEVLYACSHFLEYSDLDLPGRNSLAPFLRSPRYVFAGPAWEKMKKERENTTSFTAPVTYGPEMKALGWLERPYDDNGRDLPPGVFVPGRTSDVTAALDAFEAEIAALLDHPAFSQLGAVEVDAEEVREWRDAWAIEQPTQAERRAMARALCGQETPRTAGFHFLIAATEGVELEEDQIRRRMCGAPTDFRAAGPLQETQQAWHRMQMRQAFRFSLEAILYWLMGHLEREGASTVDRMATAFLEAVPTQEPGHSAADWLGDPMLTSPVEGLDIISKALLEGSEVGLALSAARTLSFCLQSERVVGKVLEAEDRLPLSRAQREAVQRLDGSPENFLRHVFEGWILAQHIYWSVGRGLNDSRARGKSLLRMRVVLEEEGWTLAPGVKRGNPPIPTPDRLRTVMSLAQQSGLIGPYQNPTR